MSTSKILVVDDSKSARYALRLLLQKHDYTVDTADSAESGLEKVKTDPPSAIFMDHLMPGMNGFEALEALKSDPKTASIPVVMCTSNDDEAYKRQAQEKGALDTLPKPASPDKLKAILQAIDEAVVQPAAVEPAPAPEAAAATAPAFDKAEMEYLIGEKSRSLFDAELKPLLADTVAGRVDEELKERLPGLRAQLEEELAAHAEARIGAELASAMAGLREELQGAAGNQEWEQTLDAKLQQLEGSLFKKETEHAQAVAYKLSHEVLPELVQAELEKSETRVIDRLDLRFDELADRLADDLPKSAGVMRQVAEAAETAAEHKAADIAAAQAHEIAETAAAAKAAEVADTLTHSANAALQRMYMLAGGAAAVGVLAAVVVFFLK